LLRTGEDERKRWAGQMAGRKRTRGSVPAPRSREPFRSSLRRVRGRPAPGRRRHIHALRWRRLDKPW